MDLEICVNLAFNTAEKDVHTYIKIRSAQPVLF